MKPALWGLAAAAVMALALAALLALALPVLAEPVPCGDTDDLLRRFDSAYGEKETGRGVTLNGLLARLLVGPKTWTIIVTLPSGMSCPIFAGEDWQPVQGGSL